ncbi:LysR family transcriptional regulator [Blautia producta]|uniref:LysR family transcriptional regulator n=1 Tax=Blautia producta TaxID=33035 RepID=UPI0004959EEB
MESLELRIFKEVARMKNISRAAENMGYVQSNITAHIKKLENELNTTLLIRHNKGVSLTEDGEKLLEYAEQIISLLDMTLNIFQRDIRQFKIGTTQTIAGYLLPQCLIEYQNRFPNINLSIITSNQQDMDRQLEQKLLDCVITNDPHVFTNAQCIFKTKEVLSLITPKFCESISQIWHLPIVANNLKTCPYRKILTDLYLRESIPVKIIELDTVESIINTVAAGGGISLLPQNILLNKLTVNKFDIPELEATSINIWIHKDSFPSDFITFKEIIEKLTCYYKE